MNLEPLRLAVYRHFARTGLAPTATDLAKVLGWSHDDVSAGLRALGETTVSSSTRTAGS